MLESYEQVVWLQTYEKETGFDCLWTEDLAGGEISFEEFARRNISWLESHFDDTMRRISNYPQSEKDLYGEQP